MHLDAPMDSSGIVIVIVVLVAILSLILPMPRNVRSAPIVKFITDTVP